MKNIRKLEIFFVIILFIVGLFLATYKLTASPPIWFDEANFIQIAANFINSGEIAIQVEPGKLAPAAHATVGYPLIYPLGLAFKFFGLGLLQARLVMVFFIMALIITSYLLVRELFGFKIAALTSFFLVSFPPLYGHGKNVMGEVPGIFWLVLFLFLVAKIEKSSWPLPKLGNINFFYYALAGLAAGLCVATKPYFLILLLAIIMAIFLYRKKNSLTWQITLIFSLFFIIPIAIWLKLQSQVSDSFIKMFIFYANPHGLISSPGLAGYYGLITENIRRFFTESTPIYFLASLLVWITSIIIRVKMKRKILFTEVISICFSILLSLAYLGTSGFYRYFFPANILSFIYFPYSLFVSLQYFNNKVGKLPLAKIRAVFIFLMILLTMFHFYRLGFKSWVAKHYDSKKTAELSDYFSNSNPDKGLFLYNAPEIIPFLPHNNYYQYLEFTPTLLIGEEQLGKIESGEVEEIVALNKTYNKDSDLFSAYKIKDEIAGYVVLEKESYD